MAAKTFRIGSFGPFAFDDTHTFTDATPFRGLVTDSVVNASGTPTDDNDLARVTDLASVSATILEEAKRYTLLMC